MKTREDEPGTNPILKILAILLQKRGGLWERSNQYIYKKQLLLIITVITKRVLSQDLQYDPQGPSVTINWTM